ncbi:MAG TPA: membrane protein insertase YidC [Candidatus Limnocylindrales bacterium]|nr:membrane protein insertase YidC [Candidatus Limnocylindrales bacterium]
MFDVLAVPAHALILALTALLHTPIALTIVLTTILVRLLLLPLGIDQHRAQVRTEQRRASLAERAEQLKKRFHRNPERLKAEVNALHLAEAPALARHTARGCLPVLAQMPVFTALYAAFAAPTVAGTANILLSETFLGVPLGMHLAAATGPQLAVFAAALALAAAICLMSSKALAAGRPAPPRWMKLIHYTPVLSVAFLPLAASVYLVTSMAWTVAQTVALRQWLG